VLLGKLPGRGAAQAWRGAGLVTEVDRFVGGVALDEKPVVEVGQRSGAEQCLVLELEERLRLLRLERGSDCTYADQVTLDSGKVSRKLEHLAKVLGLFGASQCCLNK